MTLSRSHWWKAEGPQRKGSQGSSDSWERKTGSKLYDTLLIKTIFWGQDPSNLSPTRPTSFNTYRYWSLRSYVNLKDKAYSNHSICLFTYSYYRLWNWRCHCLLVPNKETETYWSAVRGLRACSPKNPRNSAPGSELLLITLAHQRVTLDTGFPNQDANSTAHGGAIQKFWMLSSNNLARSASLSDHHQEHSVMLDTLTFWGWKNKWRGKKTLRTMPSPVLHPLTLYWNPHPSSLIS